MDFTWRFQLAGFSAKTRRVLWQAAACFRISTCDATDPHNPARIEQVQPRKRDSDQGRPFRPTVFKVCSISLKQPEPATRRILIDRENACRRIIPQNPRDVHNPVRARKRVNATALVTPPAFLKPTDPHDPECSGMFFSIPILVFMNACCVHSTHAAPEHHVELPPVSPLQCQPEPADCWPTFITISYGFKLRGPDKTGTGTLAEACLLRILVRVGSQSRFCQAFLVAHP